MIISQVQCAIQQMLEVHFFADYLAGSSCLARMQKVAAPKLFRRKADGARHLVHVAFHGEDALRRAKAAESSVWRSISSHRAASNADVRAMVGTSGVNRSAREHDR